MAVDDCISNDPLRTPVHEIQGLKPYSTGLPGRSGRDNPEELLGCSTGGLLHLDAITLQNFRLISQAHINLDTESVATVFVGPNNSGKTSVAEALRVFLTAGAQRAFSFDDFWAGTHIAFDAFEQAVIAGGELPPLPVIRLELRFVYSDAAEDLAVADELLMDLDEANSEVILRIDYGPRSADLLRDELKAQKQLNEERKLTELLRGSLERHYETRWYKVSLDGASADLIAPKDAAGLVARLIKVDFLPAQRHMEDQEATSQATKLSRLLHVHYEHRFKNMDPASYASVQAVVDAQAVELTAKYGDAFKEVVEALELFGYPDTPEISVRAELSAGAIFKDSTKVYYVAPFDVAEHAVGGPPVAAATYQLPERFNGLGFKNLIYMVLQLKSYRDSLRREDGFRPRVHLIVVEEPEAHLHPQMQTVFLNKVRSFLGPQGEEGSQLVITTHSSHITAAAGLTAIRYFRRKGGRAAIKDLMTFKASQNAAGHSAAFEFVSKYLTLTRCDLFYADKAILIEGTVERLLLPHMIELAKAEGVELTQTYLSIVEVGGAYAHVFKDFLKFLEIPTLIITDLDAVTDKRKKCAVADGVTTSNATLKSWLPGKQALADIRAANADERTDGLIRVSFQVPETPAGRCARSFEELFCYANAQWIVDNRAKLLGTADLFDYADAAALTADAFGIEFPKADFALDLMVTGGWRTPTYIRDGLEWLAGAAA